MTRTLLLVDESQTVGQTVLSVGESLEIFDSITDVRSSQAAVSHLQETPAALILIDLSILVRSEYELLRLMRSNSIPQAPILLLVPPNKSEGLESAMRAGCTDFIFKPLSQKELGIRLRSILERDESLSDEGTKGDDLRLLKAIADGLIILNADETVRVVNERFSTVYGYREDQLRDAPVSRIIASDDLVSITGFRPNFEERSLAGMTVSFLASDGSRIPTLVSGSAIRSKSGDVTGFTLIVRDNRATQEILAHESRAVAAERDRISGLEEIRDELKRKAILLEDQTKAALKATENALALQKEAEGARDEAEQARTSAENLRGVAVQTAERLQELDRRRTSFFQNVSHELRTPLTLILNPLEFLLKETPENSNLEVALKNAHRMLLLVNQLLDFQKLQAGKKKIKMMRVNLVDFIVNCVDYFKSACEGKGIDFKVHVLDRPLAQAVQENVSLTVRGEPDALEKITFNYLSNALKFTPRGGSITLSLSQSNQGETTIEGEPVRKVRISVTDSGPGISKEHQDSLFDVFSQIESPEYSNQGTGLGLALTKELTERMGGQVGLASQLGKGSIFWADFPTMNESCEDIDIAILSDGVNGVQLSSWLQGSDEKYHVKWLSSGSEVREFLDHRKISCLICHESCVEDIGNLIEDVKRRSPETQIILLASDETNEVLKLHVDSPNVRIFFPGEVFRSTLLTAVDSMLNNADPESIDEVPLFDDNMWVTQTNADIDTIDEVEEYQYGSNAPTGSSTANTPDTAPIIMVVDDLRDMRVLIAETLHRAKYRTIGVSGGPLALTLATQSAPDLIIIDWMMPVMGGPELIHKIRSDAKLCAIPLILLTARSDEESRIIGTEIGADAFLGKPFNSQELLSLIRNLLGLQSAERRISKIQRQQALAQIAGEVAHELNNPLNYISGGIGTLNKKVDHIASLIKSLFDGAGDEAEGMRQAFARLIDQTHRAQDTILEGVQRAAAVVAEIRGVTEVDGPIRQENHLVQVVEVELDTLQGIASHRFGSILWKNEIPRDLVVSANQHILRRLLEAVLHFCAEESHACDEPVIRINSQTHGDEPVEIMFTFPQHKESTAGLLLHQYLLKGPSDNAIALKPAARLATIALLWKDHGGVVRFEHNEAYSKLSIRLCPSPESLLELERSRGQRL